MAESPQLDPSVPTFGEIENSKKNRSRRRLPTFIIDSPSAFGISHSCDAHKTFYPGPVEVSEKTFRAFALPMTDIAQGIRRAVRRDSARLQQLPLHQESPSIFPPPRWA